MCPFSIITRCWIIFIFILALCQFVFSQIPSKWNITCDPKSPTIYMDETSAVACNVSGADMDNLYVLQIKSEDTGILTVDEEILLVTDPYDDFSKASFNMTGNFLGKTRVSLKVQKQNVIYYEDSMDVIVIRRQRVIDHIFVISVATLVALIYINFGCALNWQEVKVGLKKPIGPVIGFISQFLFMPLLSYVLGLVLFPHNTDMQLGMFFTGVAPGGGASNMWALILGGNINLSITMTTISNLAAFGMMPLWLFTLGKTIFDKSDIAVPYAQITSYAAALIIPLFIGYLIQRYLKRTSRFLAKSLKGCAALLLIFIVVFAIVTNLYLFQLFSWQILISGMGLPWLGYTLAWILAKICRQSPKDALTIAIEAGIQNTGISIFLLRVALPQPEADLTTVAPVAVATMTPLPLVLLYIYQKIKERYTTRPSSKEKIMNEVDPDVENSLREQQEQEQR